MIAPRALPLRELFVWYRVDAAQGPRTRADVLDMQRRLCNEIVGLHARLLVRRDAGAAVETWMETYALPSRAGGIDVSTEAAIATCAGALERLAGSERHAEGFTAAGALPDTGER